MEDDYLQLQLDQGGHENSVDFYSYVCSTCHTSFHSSNSHLTTCIFCGGKKIGQTESHNYSNYKYLPFEVPFEDVYDIYKHQIRHKLFLPFSFRGNHIIKKINKVYIPCSLYDMAVEGNIVFNGADRIRSVKGAPKQVFECMYSTHFDYNHLLLSNYSRINDVLISNINDYDFNHLVSFDPLILKDSCLIASDIDQDKMNEKVQDRVNKQCVGIVRGAINHEYKSLSENHLSLGVSSNQTVFIPCYFINFRYKGNEYIFLVNGQTGNTIMDVPFSTGSLLLFSVICFIVMVIIGCIVYHFI